MKTKKQLIACGLSIALIIGMIPTVEVLAAKKVSLSTKKLTVAKGKGKILKVRNTKKTVKWKVLSGKKYITLKKKSKVAVTIWGRKKGTAKVQATIGKTKLTCKVNVKDATNQNTTNSVKSTQPPVTSVPNNLPLTTTPPRDTQTPPAATDKPEQPTKEPQSSAKPIDPSIDLTKTRLDYSNFKIEKKTIGDNTYNITSDDTFFDYLYNPEENKFTFVIENDYESLMMYRYSEYFTNSEYLKFFGKIEVFDEFGRDITESLVIYDSVLNRLPNSGGSAVHVYAQDYDGNYFAYKLNIEYEETNTDKNYIGYVKINDDPLVYVTFKEQSKK